MYRNVTTFALTAALVCAFALCTSVEAADPCDWYCHRVQTDEAVKTFTTNYTYQQVQAYGGLWAPSGGGSEANGTGEMTRWVCAANAVCAVVGTPELMTDIAALVNPITVPKKICATDA
jgi:hypothetical protein